MNVLLDYAHNLLCTVEALKRLDEFVAYSAIIVTSFHRTFECVHHRYIIYVLLSAVFINRRLVRIIILCVKRFTILLCMFDMRYREKKVAFVCSYAIHLLQ